MKIGNVGTRACRDDSILITLVYCCLRNAVLVCPKRNKPKPERTNGHPRCWSYFCLKTSKHKDSTQLISCSIGRGSQQMLVHDWCQSHWSEQARRGGSNYPRAAGRHDSARAEQARNTDFSAGSIPDQCRPRCSQVWN